MTKKSIVSYLTFTTVFILLFGALPSHGQYNNKENIKVLFEADFQAEGAVKPYVETKDIFGLGFSMSRDLVAQGEGIFKGSELSGTLSWSKLATKHNENNYNNTLVIGWLYTGDGAEIMYEARGYAVRLGDENSSNWRYTAALRFEEPDAPYEWLEDIVAVWIGEFDAASGKAHYTAYISNK